MNAPKKFTDMQRMSKGRSSPRDLRRACDRHVAVSEMVIEKAKRLVEHKRDVVNFCWIRSPVLGRAL